MFVVGPLLLVSLSLFFLQNWNKKQKFSYLLCQHVARVKNIHLIRIFCKNFSAVSFHDTNIFTVESLSVLDPVFVI